MANTQIVNAAPMEIKYGTKDLGSKGAVREPEAIPQHLAKFLIKAQKGPLTPQVVVGAARDQMYGSETFNELGIFATHQTVGANVVNEQSNAQVLKRVVPADAGPEASIILYLDVLETMVDTYKRNIDGSYKRDPLGNLVIEGKVPGFKAKWVSSFHTDATKFGKLTQIAGDQSDTTGAVSTRYPIAELKHSFIGAAGNLAGIRLWAPSLLTQSVMPTKLMDQVRAYPYQFAVLKKENARSTGRVVESILGDQQILVSFKPRAIDPATNDRLYFEDSAVSRYENLTDLKYPAQYGEFGAVKVYQNSVKELLTKFHAAEVDHLNETSDFTAAADDIHLFNFVSGTDSSGAPYQSFVLVEGDDSVALTEYSTVYAQGASDGDLENNQNYEDAAIAEFNRYLDPMDEVNDIARNVESVFYDTGWSKEVKEALAGVQGGRKDVAVFLATYAAGDEELTNSQDLSLATTLRTRLQAYPESDFFGTPTIRGFIIGGSGKLRGRNWDARVPMTFEIMINNAQYMGAGNGMWRSSTGSSTGNGAMDGAPGSIVKYLTDTKAGWVPETVRNRNWDAGLNWVQSYDHRSVFFPAIKSVYPEDSSPLTGMYGVMAICSLQKTLAAAWREFSGTQRLTGNELADAINGFISSTVKDSFDNRFIIRPRAHMSNVDVRRGYSIAVPVDVGIKGMTTVHRTWIEAYRYSDLDAMIA